MATLGKAKSIRVIPAVIPAMLLVITLKIINQAKEIPRDASWEIQ